MGKTDTITKEYIRRTDFLQMFLISLFWIRYVGGTIMFKADVC